MGIDDIQAADDSKAVELQAQIIALADADTRPEAEWIASVESAPTEGNSRRHSSVG
jgi:hypothetical protein